MAYDMLLSPMKIGTMTVRNRTVMTAAEMSLGRTDGCPTEKLMDYYEERAKGGDSMESSSEESNSAGNHTPEKIR